MLELALEEAPITTQNFINLSERRFYDGTTFHRVAHNFVIQGGDAATRSPPASIPNASRIPDEFHPALRHNASGVVSMATSGPDTGTSQFFITLAPEPQLDDRHSMFGRVVSGMEVVQAIGAAPNVGNVSDGRPVSPVTVTKVRIDHPTPDPALVKRSAVLVPLIGEKVTDGHTPVTFAVVVKNTGTVRDLINLSAQPPTGWTAAFDDAAPVVPAGTGRVVLVTFTPPAGGVTRDTTVSVRATPTHNGNPALAFMFLDIGTFGAPAREGQNATADYVGFLPDGRVFDTTLPDVADSKDVVFMSSRFHTRQAYAPYNFTVGSRVIVGFSKLAEATHLGETGVARIPWQDAYYTGSMYDEPLTHRDLYFEMHLLTVA